MVSSFVAICKKKKEKIPHTHRISLQSAGSELSPGSSEDLHREENHGAEESNKPLCTVHLFQIIG